MSNSAIIKQGATLIETSTFSGASSVDFTDLSSDFILYFAELQGITMGTDGSDIMMRTSANNGSSYDSGASDYRYNLSTLATSSGSANSTGASLARITFSIGNATNEDATGIVYIFNPSSSNYTKYYSKMSYKFTDGSSRFITGGGERVSAAAVDAIQFLPDSGTFSGIINLYGVKNA